MKRQDDVLKPVQVEILYTTLKILRKESELFNAQSEESSYLNRKGNKKTRSLSNSIFKKKFPNGLEI